ncbi:MAG: hypothetical protein CMA29_03895 [Euryarchaeota archaeon]|nr:hypothetical protein [Euryarchaeota archaeon]
MDNAIHPEIVNGARKVTDWLGLSNICRAALRIDSEDAENGSNSIRRVMIVDSLGGSRPMRLLSIHSET